MGRLISSSLVVLGGVLVGFGFYNLHSLLAMPLESQRDAIASTLFPAVGGLWLSIAGVYGLTR
jgi:hypothetical protein